MSCVTRIPHTRSFVTASAHTVCLISLGFWPDVGRPEDRQRFFLKPLPFPSRRSPLYFKHTHTQHTTHSLTLLHQLFCPSSIPIHLTFSLGIPMCSLPSFFSLHLPFFPYYTVPEQFSHPDTYTMQTLERIPPHTHTHIMDLVKKKKEQKGTKEIKTTL
jgi:hypothetical protein